MAFAPTAIRAASVVGRVLRGSASIGAESAPKASIPRRRPSPQSTQRGPLKSHRGSQSHQPKQRRLTLQEQRIKAKIDARRPRIVQQRIIRLPPREEREASGEKPFYRIVRGRKRIIKWSSTLLPKPGSSEAKLAKKKPIISLPPVPNAVIDKFTNNELAKLDPAGVRTRLFSKKVKEAIRVGDIIQVRFKDPNQEAFSGVLLNIRRRGLDSGILLRNEVTRIAVEMWYKIYSPLIEGFDLVQKKAKRARRAKLYFMRKVKHDIGSVDGIVRNWKRSKTLFADQGSSFKKPGQSAFRKKQYKPAAPAVKA